MHPLGQLISERMDHPDHRWSLDDVVERATRRGEKLGRSNLARLRKEMTPQLSRATVCGLAAGLGVTPLTVANAALQSWGIRTAALEVTDAAETVQIDPTLGEGQRRQLLALIREMRAQSAHASVVAGRPGNESQGSWPEAWVASDEESRMFGYEDGDDRRQRRG